MADAPERITVLNVKGTQVYKDWYERLATFCHIPASSLFDVAVAEHAKRMGFSEPAPKRRPVR